MIFFSPIYRHHLSVPIGCEHIILPELCGWLAYKSYKVSVRCITSLFFWVFPSHFKWLDHLQPRCRWPNQPPCKWALQMDSSRPVRLDWLTLGLWNWDQEVSSSVSYLLRLKYGKLWNFKPASRRTAGKVLPEDKNVAYMHREAEAKIR